MTPVNKTALVEDAQNRAWRTFIVGLAIDIAVALAIVLVDVFTSATAWEDIQWKVVAFLVLKTIATTIGSYVLRRFLDPSRVPTPLPPAPVPPPAEPAQP